MGEERPAAELVLDLYNEVAKAGDMASLVAAFVHGFTVGSGGADGTDRYDEMARSVDESLGEARYLASRLHGAIVSDGADRCGSGDAS